MEEIGAGGVWRLSILCCILALAEPRCQTGDVGLVRRAFSSVSGFGKSSFSSTDAEGDCKVREIKLPGKNLTGAVSWMFLTNLSSLESVDLSMNSLKGSVPGRFWSMTSLQHVNLAGNRLGGTVRFEPRPVIGLSNSSVSKIQLLNLSSNRFTNSLHLSGFSGLRTLDLSGNDLRSLPYGLENLTNLRHLDLSSCNISGSATRISKLRSLEYLDISRNAMSGSFPSDFPSLEGIKFLNISMNNFTVLLGSDKAKKFSPSAFIEAGISVYLKNHPPRSLPPPPPLLPPPEHHHQASSGVDPSRLKQLNSKKTHKPRTNDRRKALIIGSASSATLIAATGALFACLYGRKKRLQRRKKWAITKPQPPVPAIRADKYMSGPFSFETETGTWVAEVRDPASAPVVMFEKPLMRLTFSDLLSATSGFGQESQLAEGRRGGPVYRAVLPGDIHVAIKVLERARNMDADTAIGLFEELARVRHPNLLPLAGYCVAGKEKLILSEFMVYGDLHRWLHELPAGRPNVEDWSTDTWENPYGAAVFSAEGSMVWPMRHRVALGVARGLAFLHHAGSRPLIHGHVVATNVLLDEDFEPRLADFGLCTGAGAGIRTTESDVHAFGVVLLELLTGEPGSDDMVARVRRLVRERRGSEALDQRLRAAEDDDSAAEMAEGLRVGYLCTAESADKRPTMQQVVGMLKDVHRGRR